MDLALNFGTGDLDLAADGSPHLVSGQRAIAQHVWIRLRFVLGEWFLDQREGVPYYERILVADPDLGAIEEAYRKTILGTPGIESITSYAQNFDRKLRRLTVSFEAITTDGSTLRSSDYASPFLVVGGS